MIRRWTPLFIVDPSRYVESVPDDFDIATWDYEWDRDPFKGRLDFVSPVEKTIERGHGDCEDYAVVAASWLDSRGDDYEFYVCLSWWPPKGHVIVYDGTRTYSSGVIREETVEEYAERTEYDVVL